MKLCIILTTRGNYAKFKRFIELAGDIKIATILAGDFCTTEIPELYDGFRLSFRRTGDSLFNIAQSAGDAVIQFSETFNALKPDLVMLVGDRWETHSAATAAYLCGIPIAHLEGGELSGTLDNHLRYAISELSTYHFPCTEGSAWRLNDRGYDNIHMVGATSIDVLANAELEPPVSTLIDFKDDLFLLVVQHPDTSNYDDIEREIEDLVLAIDFLTISTVWIGPNVDAGSNYINNRLEEIYRKNEQVNFYDSLPIEQYGYLLKHAACIVGNSSSGIRESCIFGTPNVSVGKRQDNREHGGNSVFVEAERNQIVGAVKAQMVLGHSEPIYTYGDGHASEKILEVIKGI